jgi:hypothetical protein
MENKSVKITAPKIAFLASMGKFLATLTEDQSSTTNEATNKIGIVRRFS